MSDLEGDLEEISKLLCGNWAPVVTFNTDLWVLEGTSIGSPLVLAVASLLEWLVGEELNDELLFAGQVVFGLGHGVAHQQLAAVGDVVLGNDLEHLLEGNWHLVDGVVGVTSATSAVANGGEDQRFLGDGKGGNGSGGQSDLRAGQDNGAASSCDGESWEDEGG